MPGWEGITEPDNTAVEIRRLEALRSILARLPVRGKRTLSALLVRWVAPGVRHVWGDVRGIRMRLDLSDRAQRWMYFGLYDEREAALLESLLSPGGCFLDIGANVGFYTVHAAARVGPAGQVHAFEPLPANVAALRETIRENHLAQVHLVDAAVSDREGEVAFHAPPEGESGWGRVAGGSEGETIRVRCVTVDGYLARLAEPPGRVDAIKLDIEGHEMAALQGMRRTLERDRPAILMEMNLPMLAAAGVDPETMGDWLLDMGYTARIIGRRGACLPYDFRRHPEPVFNILAEARETEWA